ncbi:unnamed protein product, partial [Rotaria sp. Silwood2]
VLNKLSPIKHRTILNDNDIPLPTYDDNDDQELPWNNKNIIEKKKSNKNRRKK